MIIDKVKPFVDDLTDEERQAWAELDGASDPQAMRELLRRVNEKWATVELRYAQSLNKDPEALLADVREILDAITVEDFYSHIDELRGFYEKLQSEGLHAGDLENTRALQKDFSQFFFFLFRSLSAQIRVPDLWGIDHEEAEAIVLQIRALMTERAAKDFTPPPGFTFVIPKASIVDIDLGEEPSAYLRTILPREFVTTTDKVRRTIIGKEDFQALVNVGGKHKEVKTLVTINREKLQGAEIKKATSDYDFIVMDAVVSLILAGNSFITNQMIYRTMTGNTEGKLTPNHEARINQSLDQLQSTNADIDPSEELDAHYITDGTRISGPLLAFYRISPIVLNGTETSAIQVLAMPPLYTYAVRKNQVAHYPISLLDAPINKTEKNIVLQQYLLDRVHAMKNKKADMSKAILYAAIYEKLEISGTAAGPVSPGIRKKQQAARESAKAILQTFKEQGYIKNYAEAKKSGKAYSLTITL